MSDNKFKDFVQSKTGTVLIVGVIAFGIGFFSGTEYIKYELRKAFSGVTDTFSSNITNTNSSSLTNTPPKAKTKVGFQQSAQDGSFNLKVDKVEWVDEAKSSFLSSTDKPKNKYLVITIEAENIGKKNSFPYISGYKLLTDDGKEYDDAGYISASQLSKDELPNGYTGCISCGLNPEDKAMERIYFDLKQGDLKNYKLVSDNFEFSLS